MSWGYCIDMNFGVRMYRRLNKQVYIFFAPPEMKNGILKQIVDDAWEHFVKFALGSSKETCNLIFAISYKKG